MALLYRMVNISDRTNTCVFSFIVTRTALKEIDRDTNTKDFLYGSHRFSVTFSIIDNHVGVYLVWRTFCEQLLLNVDFSFTLLNQQHFSRNCGFSGKNICFTYTAPAHGKRRFISLAQLNSQNFIDSNGECQLELTVTNLKTTYNFETSLSKQVETRSCTYGGFHWSFCLQKLANNQFKLTTTCANGPTQYCRIIYQVAVNTANMDTITSSEIDQLCDASYCSDPWTFALSGDQPAGGVIRYRVGLLSTHCVSLLTVQVVDAESHVISDMDKQQWAIMFDTNGLSLRIIQYFKDVRSVPKNHLKLLLWNMYININEKYKQIKLENRLSQSPFGGYYIHELQDDGVMINTDIPLDQLRLSSVFKNSQVTTPTSIVIYIEWISNALLFQSTYHRYDDIVRTQAYQMRREISALHMEKTKQQNDPTDCTSNK